MREFTITNGWGAFSSLTDTKLLLYNPSGLGFEREDGNLRIGDRWVRVTKSLSQLPISGNVAFMGEDPYQQYLQFVNFCNVDPLILHYRSSGEIYSRRVTLKRIDKSEINSYGFLDCPVEFLPYTPWYREISAIKVPSSSQGLKFPFTWPVTFTGSDNMTLEVESDSFMDSPCKLRINGFIRSPYWRHYVNGVLVAEGKVNYNVPTGNRLIIDSTTDPYRIYVTDRNGNFVADAYQFSDFATTRFLNLQRGTNVITVSSAETNDPVTVALEAQLYYETV